MHTSLLPGPLPAAILNGTEKDGLASLIKKLVMSCDYDVKLYSYIMATTEVCFVGHRSV